ncbi:MAG: tRNA (guanine(46)-N(7))-methyltransferase TrmB [Alphaproteobacteria bacterium]|nr:tRNA (guanine(46)-N(7))-methyltransferase TrmB [Alphaproteobacteria bacterium SS10]
MQESDAQPRRRGDRFYGRRRGRPLRAGRADALTTLPEYGLPVPPEGETYTADELIGPDGLFGREIEDFWLEIGFGNGEHTLHIAETYPNVGILGFEPFLNGVAAMLNHMHARKIENVRVFPDDARKLLPAIPNSVVGRLYLQFPDPWPKTKHHRRRFLQPSTLDRFAAIMKPGAELRLATDDPRLADWMMERTWRHPAFKWQAEQASDWRVPPEDWSPTRYFEKAVAQGRCGYFLNFTRIDEG